jgi:hypothetical protein
LLLKIAKIDPQFDVTAALDAALEHEDPKTLLKIACTVLRRFS